MGLDESQVVGSDVIFQINRLVLGRRTEAPQAIAHFFRVHMQSPRNQVSIGIEIAAGIAQEQRSERRIIVYDGPAFAVQNLSTRGQDWKVADFISLRLLRVLIALHHLEPPQSISQHQKYGQDDVLCCSEADRRYFFVAAEHQIPVACGQLPVRIEYVFP